MGILEEEAERMHKQDGEACCETLSSREDMTTALGDSLQLQLLTLGKENSQYSRLKRSLDSVGYQKWRSILGNVLGKRGGVSWKRV